MLGNCAKQLLAGLGEEWAGRLSDKPLCFQSSFWGRVPSQGIASLFCCCPGRLPLGEMWQGLLDGGQRRIPAWARMLSQLPANLLGARWGGRGSLPFSRPQFPHPSLEGFGLCHLRWLPKSSSSQSLPGGVLQSLGQTQVRIITLLQAGHVTCSPSLSEHYPPGGENRMAAMPSRHGCCENSQRWCLYGSQRIMV